MKRLLAILIVLPMLFAMFTLSASAEDYDPLDEISYSLGKEYTSLKRSNLSRNKELVKYLGHTVSSLKEYMIAEDIYLIAAGEEAKGEFHIKCRESSFTKEIYSLNGYENSELEDIKEGLMGGNGESVKIGETIYFRVKSKTESAKFYTYQYLTVQNGRLYSFIYYGSDSAEIDDFIKTVKIRTAGSGNRTGLVINIIILVVVIIAGLVGMGLLGVMIYKDIRKKTDSDEETETISIKRRKM